MRTCSLSRSATASRCFCSWACMLSAGSAVRWLRVERSMRMKTPLPLPLIVPLLAAAGALAASVVLVVILLALIACRSTSRTHTRTGTLVFNQSVLLSPGAGP